MSSILPESVLLEIEGIEPRGANTWLVIGRTFNTISVNDLVYTHENLEGASPGAHTFRIIKILFCERELSEITQGYAAGLILKGKRGESLALKKYLHKV